MFEGLECTSQYSPKHSGEWGFETQLITHDLDWEAICQQSCHLQAFPSFCEVDEEEILRKKFDTGSAECPKFNLNRDIRVLKDSWFSDPYEETNGITPLINESCDKIASQICEGSYEPLEVGTSGEQTVKDSSKDIDTPINLFKANKSQINNSESQKGIKKASKINYSDRTRFSKEHDIGKNKFSEIVFIDTSITPRG